MTNPETSSETEPEVIPEQEQSPVSEKPNQDSSNNGLSRIWWIVLGIMVIDQLTKWTVLQKMFKGQSIDLLGDWLKFTFTENPGMAFGIEYGYPGLITFFSIIATCLIVFYTFKVGTIYRPYQISLAFVLGGALGNIIDRVFYGAILYDDPLFVGKVVDFIHVNVWRGVVHESVPFIGGRLMALFPIWNVADMAIVAGVIGILVFQKKFHLNAEQIEDEKGWNEANVESE